MHIVLHDFGQHLTFAPLTFTRPVGNLRSGMWTNNERWQFYFPSATISYATEKYLAKKFPLASNPDTIWVNAAFIPTPETVGFIKNLKLGEALFINATFVANRAAALNANQTENVVHKTIEDAVILQRRWDLFKRNDAILKADFAAYTKGKKSAKLSTTNTLLGDADQLFIEEGAVVECAILNVESGPIYIGKNAEIMENVVVRGAFAMAEHSVLKMSAKVYGATSLGPYCKVGGEVNNVIFQAYSNKGHDGFLGNALIGEWCNLGADTNCSNLKNDYGKVKTYNYFTLEMEQTEEQFMGLSMGDFSKSAINTMFNTATSVGVAANIFINKFPPKVVPSFSWGGMINAPKYELEKSFIAANAMMERRGQRLSKIEEQILSYLFADS